MSNPRPLPDVAFEAAQLARPLDWVGMDNIALPLRLDEALQVPAQVDVAVSLDDADKRGIHMSRLYLHVQTALPETRLDAASLGALMQTLIASQQGLANRARLRLRFERLLLRPALLSDNQGWRCYPVSLTLEANAEGELDARLQVAVEYSSTCPASAALSRQLNADAFAAAFARESVGVDEAKAWLASKAGLAATPHAQRSVAEVNVQLAADFDSLPIETLVNALEQALGTPVQTAVKREDEQAFARANAENLMFCEDAARRVGAALYALPIGQWQARVAHLESLHAHDAVASVSGYGVG